MDHAGEAEPRKKPVAALMAYIRDEALLHLRLLKSWPIWPLLLATVAALVTAYQVPQSIMIDVGSPQDEAYVQNFHGRLEEDQKSFRWSGVYSYITLAGLGGARPFDVVLTFNPPRRGPLTIIVNGATLFDRSVEPGRQEVTLRVDERQPVALASRDTVIEIRAQDYRSPDLPTQPKGIQVDQVRVTQDSSGPFIVPAYKQSALLVIPALLVFLLVGRTALGYASLGRSRIYGLLAAVLFAAMGAYGLSVVRLAVFASAGHVALTLALTVLISVLARLILSHWLKLTARTANTLALCLACAFALRYGGMALPQAVIIDMPWHMKWLHQLLTGDWQSLYFPGGLSRVPAEWGLDLLIPKSPLFYFMFAPLNLVPADLETLVKGAICLLDASLVLAAFWLARRAGAGDKAALCGAALYAVMPLAFRAFAYGILPTIFAQWLSVLLFALVLLWSNKQWRVGRWAALLVLASLALLSFPTVAVFVSIVLLLVSLVWWLDSRHATGMAYEHLRIPLLLGAAWALAIWAYYGLYISPVMASASALLAPRPGAQAVVRWPGGLPDLIAWTGGYVVTVLPALLAGWGLDWLLAPRGVSRASKRTVRLLAIWLAIAPLFIFANYRVDMIGKHLFFTMLPVAVAGGVFLWRLAPRGRWGTLLVALLLATVFWQGVVFWVSRLVEAST